MTGSIEVGKLADLAVIDRNLFEHPGDEIAEATVELTFVEGECVFDVDVQCPVTGLTGWSATAPRVRSRPVLDSSAHCLNGRSNMRRWPRPTTRTRRLRRRCPIPVPRSTPHRCARARADRSAPAGRCPPRPTFRRGLRLGAGALLRGGLGLRGPGRRTSRNPVTSARSAWGRRASCWFATRTAS